MRLFSCAGGWLYQQADTLTPDDITFTPVSERQPTPEQLADLRFAWLAVKHVKSNAIAIAKDQRLLGMGSGQPNRVKSAQIALEKAGQDAQVRSCHELMSCRLGCWHDVDPPAFSVHACSGIFAMHLGQARHLGEVHTMHASYAPVTAPILHVLVDSKPCWVKVSIASA